MADIHIQRIIPTETGKGRAQLVYHIPIAAPVAGVVPTPTSSVESQLQQSEKAALAAGTVVEVVKTIVVLDSQLQSEIVAATRVSWNDVAVDYNRNYDFAYKFYGVTLDANP